MKKLATILVAAALGSISLEVSLAVMTVILLLKISLRTLRPFLYIDRVSGIERPISKNLLGVLVRVTWAAVIFICRNT